MRPGEDPAALIPHRPPILCIDRVLASTSERAAAERAARDGPDGFVWEGQLIEGLAQTAAAMLHRGLEEGGRRLAKGMLVGIRGLRLARLPATSEAVRFEAELIRAILPLALVRGRAMCGGETVAEGELKFFVESRP